MDVSILDGSCRRCCCPCRCHPFAPKQDLFYMVFMPLHLQMSHFKTKLSQNVFLNQPSTKHLRKASTKHHPPNKTHTHFPEQKLPPKGTNIIGSMRIVVGDGSTSTQVRIHKVGFWGKRRQLHCTIGLVRVG